MWLYTLWELTDYIYIYIYIYIYTHTHTHTQWVMLQRTVFLNKIRMLQRTRRNTIGRRCTRVRMTCRTFPLWLERQPSSLLSFVRFSYQFNSVISSDISSVQLSVQLSVQFSYQFSSVISSVQLSVQLSVQFSYQFSYQFSSVISSVQLSVQLSVQFSCLSVCLYAV